MKIEVGSTWVDDDYGLDIVVKSIIAAAFEKTKVVYDVFDNTGDYLGYNSCTYEVFLDSKTPKTCSYEDVFKSGYNKAEEYYKSMQEWLNKEQFEEGFKEGKEANKDDQNLNYRVGFNDGWHDCEASFELGNEFTDSIQAQAYDEGYVEGYNQHEYEMHQVMSEREFESIIDEAFEEGYAQAYSEIQTKTERERALQEKAWDEGYSQAISDVIDEDFEDDYSEECYSEYEFGDVEGGEEEYCFSKELDKILNGAFVVDTKSDGSERKHSHYFKDVRHLDYIDVYEINKLFPVDDDTDCILHARKKLLVCGGRGGSKDMVTDITDARDTLNRYLQIEGIE